MGSHTFGVSCPACNGFAFRTDYTWASHEVICFDCGYHYDHDGAVFSFRDLISRLIISGGTVRDAGKALCAGRVDFCIVIDMDERGFLVKTEPCSAEDFDLELNEEILGGIETEAEADLLANFLHYFLNLSVYNDVKVLDYRNGVVVPKSA